MKFWLLFIGLCIEINLHAQSITHFTRLSEEDGMSNNTIQALMQDSKGFIWMGTGNGLNIYDGYNFKVFKSNQPFRNIKNGYIYGLMEDSKKRVWVATAGGANLYDSVLDQLILKDQPIININRSNSVYDFFETNDHTILSCTEWGINRFDETSKQFVRFTPPDLVKFGLHEQRIAQIIKDSKQNYWVATQANGIYIYNSKFVLQKSLQAGELESNGIAAMTMDKDGNIWVGYSDKGLDCISPQYKRIRHYNADGNKGHSLSSNVVKCLLKDSENNIWIGTENGGVNMLDIATDEITWYEATPNNLGGISQKTVISLMEGQQKNIWIGTIRGGVNIYSSVRNRFKSFTSGLTSSYLSYKDVKSFFEGSDGTIYVNTDGGGLNVWNRKEGKFTYYQNKKDQNSISSDAVLCTFEDSRNNIWIGTWAGGLNHFDRKTGKFTAYKKDPNDPNSISDNNVWQIIEADDGLLWIGTSWGGLNIFDPVTKKFTRLLHGKDNRGTIYGNNISDLAKDKNGNMWIATQDGGLNLYNTHTGLIQHFFVSYVGKQRKYEYLRAVYCDTNGDIWVAPTKGLYKYDKASNSFIVFSKRASIANADINSIIDDNSGNLWCGTETGILKINKLTQSTSLYNALDGLQGTQFPRHASYKLRSGELLFGCVNGFNLFDPAKITTNDAPPNIYITNVSVLSEPVYPSTQKNAILKKQIYDNGSIVMNHQQAAFFSVDFAALNYIAPAKNQYAYQLDGYDDRIIYIENQRRVSFTNLNSGNYTLRVIAANNDGVWNKKGAVLHIKILPPFWKTWWFGLIISAIALAAIVVYFRMYRNLIQQKINDKKQEEIRNMELDFFTHISHEFRTPLTVISGASEKIQEKASAILPKEYFNLLNRNVAKMSDMVSEIMDFRKLESGDIKLQVTNQNINLIIKQIAEDFVPIAELKHIDYSIKLDVSSINQIYFDPTFIERITSNLLNNAFKYTPKNGRVSIQVTENISEFNTDFEDKISYFSETRYEKYIYLIVKDNGIGISNTSLQQVFTRFYRVSNSQLGSGVGLAFIRKLTLLHKGFIQLYSKKNEGTHILIAVPMLEKYYLPTEKSTRNEMVEKAPFESSTVPKDVLPEIDYNPIPVEAPEADNSSKKHSILIVEDNSEIRNLLSAAFSETYNIYEAENGVEGLKKAQELLPHLIITDLMMPEMNGIELCSALKNDDLTNHIPIIMLTARNDNMSKIEGTESGADYYFTKPISIKILGTTISNLFFRSNKYKSKFLADYQQEMRSSISDLKDREVIESLLLIIDNQIDNPELDIPLICKSIGMSKSSLFKIIKNATGKSINEFIRSTRLQKAKHIMINEKLPVNEVMERVGILSASYFTRAFKNEFGVLPSSYKQ